MQDVISFKPINKNKNDWNFTLMDPGLLKCLERGAELLIRVAQFSHTCIYILYSDFLLFQCFFFRKGGGTHVAALLWQTCV
jgi:hypothetical protein